MSKLQDSNLMALAKISFMPTRRMVGLFMLLLLTGLVVSIWTSLAFVWHSGLILLLLVALNDLWQVFRMPPPSFKRNLASALSLGVRHEARLSVRNNTEHSVTVDVFDHVPEQLEFEAMPRRLLLSGNEYAELVYFIKPLSRGRYNFQSCECQLHSPYGLWKLRHVITLKEEVKVYPNYAPVIEYALLATENHLGMMGILKRRRRGQGMDFHQLREFREGDSMRQIDWKASSRIRKLIAREYQDERDQQIIVMMDCGYRMLTQDDELAHFDHSLNAILLMSYVALRQGDSVGLSTFSDHQQRWIKPVKGVANINHLLNGIFDLQPGTGSPDYATGARQLLLRQRKRSLVILITNLRDDDSEELQASVHLLAKYHKVVVVSLREQAIEQRLDASVNNLSDALTVASTHDYLARRRRILQLFRSQGINILDVLPRDLPLSLANTYLELKSSGQI